LFVGVKRSLRQSRRYPEPKFYPNRQRKVNWNHNEKRTEWLADGDRWISSPSRTSQVWSYPYDFKDFDEKEEDRIDEAGEA